MFPYRLSSLYNWNFLREWQQFKRNIYPLKGSGFGGRRYWASGEPRRACEFGHRMGKFSGLRIPPAHYRALTCSHQKVIAAGGTVYQELKDGGISRENIAKEALTPRPAAA